RRRPSIGRRPRTARSWGSGVRLRGTEPGWTRDYNLAMDYIRLGDSGLMVAPLCLGTMMFGDRTDEAASAHIIGKAHDAGFNFIDTADVYTKGASERIVGAAIKAQRREWILATKCGNVMTKAPHDGGLSRRWVLRA